MDRHHAALLQAAAHRANADVQDHQVENASDHAVHHHQVEVARDAAQGDHANAKHFDGIFQQ